MSAAWAMKSEQERSEILARFVKGAMWSRPDNEPQPANAPGFHASCRECGRVFDLLDETDSQEWAYGHDCEVPTRR